MISANKQRLRYIVGDFMATNLAWLLFNVVRYFQVVVPMVSGFCSFGQYYSIPPVILGQIFFPLVMMAIYWLSGYYNHPFFKSRTDEFMTTFYTAAFGAVVIFFIAVVDDPIPDRASNLELLALLFGLLFFLVYFIRLTITRFAIKQILRGNWTQPVAIVGLGKKSNDIRRKIEKIHGRGYKVVAFIDPQSADSDEFAGLPVYSVAQLAALKERENLSAVIVADTPSNRVAEGEFTQLLHKLFPLEIPILIPPSSLQVISSKPQVGDIAAEPFINICSARLTDAAWNFKRCGDVAVSALALVLLSPLFLIIAAMIRRESKGPVFYRQERLGLHKKPFRIIKFRTMVTDAESAGPRLSSENDPRVTRVGQTLRKYRLDELPQFWNVLRGEMSLVGPRPEREFFVRQIIAKAPYYTLLHQVRPGITSWGMVKYGYATSVDEMIERSHYDLLYLENISLIIDLKILLHTVNTVASGRGV